MTATLQGLAVGSLSLTPGFDPDVTDYTATTANTADSITATPTDSAASIYIQVNGTPHRNGDPAQWNPGDNEVTVAVQNGGEQKVYTLLVTYTPPSPPDSRLSVLTIGSLALTPLFDPTVLDYTTETTNNTNTVTAIPVDGTATVTMEVDDTPLVNGKATWNDGDNVLAIQVTSGADSRTYTVTVTKT